MNFDFVGFSLEALPEFIKFVESTARLSGLDGMQALVLLIISEYDCTSFPFTADFDAAVKELEKAGVAALENGIPKITGKGAIIVKALINARDKFNRKISEKSSEH